MNRPASAHSCRSVAHDFSSASVVCNEKTLRALRPLREIYKSPHMDNSFSRKERRERKDSRSCYAGAGGSQLRAKRAQR